MWKLMVEKFRSPATVGLGVPGYDQYSTGRGSPPTLSKYLEKQGGYQWKKDFWMFDDNYLLRGSY